MQTEIIDKTNFYAFIFLVTSADQTPIALHSKKCTNYAASCFPAVYCKLPQPSPLLYIIDLYSRYYVFVRMYIANYSKMRQRVF